MRAFLDDVRHGIRRLRGTPLLTGAAVASLALGVGANGAIFGAIRGLLLTPLPYESPDELVRVWGTYAEREGSRFSLSYPNYRDFADVPALESLAAVRGRSYTLAGELEAERVLGIATTADLFGILGVEPALGRAFGPDEDGAGGRRVAILAHRLWERRFSSDPAVLGATLSVNGEPYTIVGVMPPGFDYPADEVALWVTLRADESNWGRARGGLSAVGRLAPGATVEGLRSQLREAARRIAADHPGNYEGYGALAITLPEVAHGETLRPILIAVAGAVTFLLLIACINLANLLLARTRGRIREVALRAALGARRGRIVRLFLVESGVLAFAGGVAGIAVAYGGVRFFRWAGAALSISPDRLEGVVVDPPVLAFTLGLAAASGLLFGVFPAAEAARTDINALLREGGRGRTAGGRSRRAQRLLVGAQVAFALVVLTGAGLMARSIRELATVDPGYRTEGVLAFSVTLTPEYDSASRISGFQDEVLRGLRALPGVRSAAAVRDLPLGGGRNWVDIVVADDPDPGSGRRTTGMNTVTPGYFRTMEIPGVRGRTFRRSDDRGSPPVTVVSRAMVESTWPGEDGLGRRIALPGERTAEGRPVWRTVVGVVENVRHGGLRADPRGEMYVPYTQVPWTTEAMTFVVAGPGDVAALAPAARRVAAGVDPGEAVYDMATMAARIGDEIRADLGLSWLLGSFGLVALLLASVGVFGVVSYGVARRRREMGIRLTLGAGEDELVRMVVRQGLLPVLAGIGIGVVGAAVLSTSLSELLFRVPALDPATFVAVPLVLVGVAAAAVYVPARRAATLDPVETLREE